MSGLGLNPARILSPVSPLFSLPLRLITFQLQTNILLIIVLIVSNGQDNKYSHDTCSDPE